MSTADTNPLAEWTTAELKSAVTSQHIFGVIELQEMVEEMLRRERTECEMQYGMASGCLDMIRKTLIATGCGCGPDAHAGTPAMMYPEWIACCLRSAVAKARDEMKERCAAAVAKDVARYAEAARSLPTPGKDEYGLPTPGPHWTPHMDGVWAGLQMAEHMVRELT